MKFKEYKFYVDIKKFKDFSFSSYYENYIKYKIIIVFNDNKKVLITKPYEAQKILGDCEILNVYMTESYIKEEYLFFIHLNISSKDYKKILGY